MKEKRMQKVKKKKIKKVNESSQAEYEIEEV